MVQSFGNVDIKPWIGILQHDFVLSFLIGMTNEPKIKKREYFILFLTAILSQFEKMLWVKWESSFTAVTNNLTSLFPLNFLSKHISLYALGRLKWILDIIWPFNQHFNLKNQRNWIKQVLMINFLIGINCILLHWPKKLTLVKEMPRIFL